MSTIVFMNAIVLFVIFFGHEISAPCGETGTGETGTSGATGSEAATWPFPWDVENVEDLGSYRFKLIT